MYKNVIQRIFWMMKVVDVLFIVSNSVQTDLFRATSKRKLRHFYKRIASKEREAKKDTIYLLYFMFYILDTI